MFVRTHTKIGTPHRVLTNTKCLGGKYLEIAQHEAPCDFLEGVAHCNTKFLVECGTLTTTPRVLVECR